MSNSPTSSAGVIPILMPEAGNTMEEGSVLAWRVQVGAQVVVGEILCEIETDKATIEYESPAAGRLAKIVAAEGDIVAVKQPIAYFAESDAELSDYLAAAGGGDTNDSAEPSGAVANQSTVTPAAVLSNPTASPPLTFATDRGLAFPASPAVRRLARERGFDLTSFGKGSGPGGRILTTDLDRLAALPAAASSASTTRQPLSKMRRRIGERLVSAKQSIPHFYVRTTVIADDLWQVFQQMKGDGCTLNDLVMLACGKTLLRFPGFRSRIEGDEIVEETGVHIGMAVGLDEGLVVPVVRDVQQMSLVQLSVATRQIVDNARRGTVANMGTGVFTISNLGMYGVEEFSAIINPPEAGILAVGAVREEVIVENGAMRPGRVMTLTLSADHRVVDGVMAAQFMADLKRGLESIGELVGTS